MKAIRSAIFMLSYSDFAPGICAVCGSATIIRFRDTSTGFGMGACCLHFALSAERALAHPDAGLRAPTKEESDGLIPNH